MSSVRRNESPCSSVKLKQDESAYIKLIVLGRVATERENAIRTSQ
jgi:hypothetical protein